MRRMMKCAAGLNRNSERSGTRAGALSASALAATALVACATVKVQAPDKPIEINLNVKIQQEVRVTLDKAAADLISKNPDLF